MTAVQEHRRGNSCVYVR